ncbi:MAG: hypothetical protein ACPGSD_03995 [Flavobacteriales bacterium]
MNKNKKFFQSGAGSNIGSFSNFYKKSKKTNTNTEGQISDEILDDLESKIDSNTRKLNTKVNREEGKTLSDENFKHSEKKKLDGIESGANNYIHPDKHSISEILELQSKLDEKVQKDGVKGLSEEDFTSVLKNKLNDIDLNRIVSGSQDTGITIVSEDIFEIEKSGFYYASASAKNTPERMVGFFILEVLSKRDKRITFSGPEQNVIYTIQKQDGKWLEWQSFSQIPHELKTKLSDLPDSKALESLFGGKINKHPTKDLSTNDYSNTEKSKLSGIETGANKYVHPASHSMSEISGLSAKLNTKVDKEQNKGLSTNDFTNTEKSKLSGIETGANKYVHPASHSMSEISGLSSKLNTKVDKEQNKGLSTNDFTNTEKSKLSGIAIGANKYVHPASHSMSEISGLQSELDSKQNKPERKSQVIPVGRSGWYTFAVCSNGRAIGKFVLKDTTGGRHQTLVLYASHLYGTGHTINVLSNAQRNFPPFQKLRMKRYQSYDGVVIQVYIETKDRPSSFEYFISGDNLQHEKWKLVYPTIDSECPIGINKSKWSSFIIDKEIDLLKGNGSLHNTGDIYVDNEKLIKEGELNAQLKEKVDKHPSKDLSTNDFTNTEKSKLSGIATGANKYVHPASHSISEISGLSSELDTKVDKEQNKGLSTNDFTNTDKSRLDNHNHDDLYERKYKKDILVKGDSDKYYGVVIKGGNQNVIRTLEVYRSYHEKAPSTWYSKTHKAGLTAKFRLNFGGWGGSTYDWKLEEYRKTYAQTFGGAQLTNHSTGFVIFLRGGEALYHITSSQPLDIQITYGKGELTYFHEQDRYKVYAPQPLTNPRISEIQDHIILKSSEIDSKLDLKVNKISGKGLSDTNFSQTEKSKLSGIATGANKYVHPASHSMSEISGLSSKLDTKVDKEPNKGLSTNDFTNAEKSKLSKAWTSSNDGSGSGLDADKLDGLEAAQFGVKSSSQTWTKKNVFSDDVTFGMGSDLNNYHIQKIHQDSAASYNERVVLLIPKSITNQAQVNKCVGTIVLSKLGGNVWDVVNVSIQSVWNTVKGSMISEGMNASKNRLVYCNYKGTKWVALKIGYTANPHNNMFFNGHSIVFTDDVNRLKCIAYKNNKTGAVLNKEIFDSIEEVKGLNDDIYVNNGIKLVNHHEILSINDLNTKFNSKIDKHPSKDLSTNDYSNAEKSKLAGIATGAERNVNPDWNATSGDAFIKNKPVIPNPVKLENELNASSESGLTNQAITKALDDKEDRFGKRTGFNKNFGTSSGTVAQGNDSRINHGQTAYTWGNHANANYIKPNSSGNVGIGASTPATKLHVNGGHLRVQSAYGYADFGSLNSSFFHFNTNRPKYYFNRKTEIDGDIKIYGKNTYLRKSDGAVIENGSRLAKQSTVDQLNKRIDELQKQIETQTISKLEVDRESFKILSRAGKPLAEIPLEVLKEAILG